jgi:predicted nucleic acid-binding Zn ribbon protein
MQFKCYNCKKYFTDDKCAFNIYCSDICKIVNQNEKKLKYDNMIVYYHLNKRTSIIKYNK